MLTHHLFNSLKVRGVDYVLKVKPKSHKTLFKYIDYNRKRGHIKTFSYTQDGIQHEFEHLNKALINDRHPTLRVHFLHYTQTDKKGNKTVFTWVTNISIRQNWLVALMRAARTRWKVENETFNTLTHLGDHFKPNFRPGKDHLATMFAFLMLTTFYMDQLLAAYSLHFQELEEKLQTKLNIWDSIKVIFHTE